MWLTRQLTKTAARFPEMTPGEISESGAARLSVQGAQEHREARQLAPYGVLSSPPVGGECVTFFAGDKTLCAGLMQGETEIQPGELLLFSQGGVSVHLKNDGTVVINGRVFPAAQEE